MIINDYRVEQSVMPVTRAVGHMCTALLSRSGYPDSRLMTQQTEAGHRQYSNETQSRLQILCRQAGGDTPTCGTHVAHDWLQEALPSCIQPALLRYCRVPPMHAQALYTVGLSQPHICSLHHMREYTTHCHAAPPCLHSLNADSTQPHPNIRVWQSMQLYNGTWPPTLPALGC
jgi:hypothetical protein